MDQLTCTFLYSFEAPEIALSLKRLVLCLLEENWKNINDEFCFIMNLERASLSHPRYDVFVSCLLGLGQHRMNFHWERLLREEGTEFIIIIIVMVTADDMSA
jgi:hypothetical protein